MKVKFVVHDEVIEVDAEEGRTLLDISLIAGIPAPYSCMEGRCGTCEVLILQGETSEKGPVVRACQALPKSENLVVKIA